MADTHVETASAQVRAAAAAGATPEVRTFFDEATFTATHVVHDPKTRRAAIVDSVLDFDAAAGRTDTRSADAIVRHVEEAGLTVDWLLETHAHADHLSAAPHLQDRLGGRLAIGRSIVTVQETFAGIFNLEPEFARDGSQFDVLFDDGSTFAIGGIPAVALHVPGHTPADMAYVVGDAVFTGDTIFMPDYGTARADFPGGDARRLFGSIRRLLSLPGRRGSSSATTTRRPVATNSSGKPRSPPSGRTISTSMTGSAKRSSSRCGPSATARCRCRS